MANYATRDERNAKCISQRVQETVRQAVPDNVFCFDDDTKQEYYLFLNDDAGTALVHNYGIDVWYLYTGLPVVCGCRDGAVVVFGMSDGRLVLFGEEFPNDDGEAIDAFFASGHMAFDRDHQKKHSSVFWVSVKPTANANLQVTVRSDRKSIYPDKDVIMSLSTFCSPDFSRWSFLTYRSPQVQRLRVKVRRFVYCQLILKSRSRASDATVLAVDCDVRYLGNVT